MKKLHKTSFSYRQLLTAQQLALTLSALEAKALLCSELSLTAFLDFFLVERAFLAFSMTA